MKTIKSLTLCFLVMALMVASCKKDEKSNDNSPSSNGSFTVDGKKFALQKCYAHFSHYTTYTEYVLYIVSKDITVNSTGEGSGTGDAMLIQCRTPQNLTTILAGDYTYNLDSNPLTPSTYFDCFVVEGFGTAGQVSLEPEHSVIFKMAKSGDTYEFSANGKTTDGKTFDFYYKGPITPLSSKK